MSTTAVFAELLVGGLLSVTWIVLFILAAIGLPQQFPGTDKNLAVEVGLLLALAYALGVVFDRLWGVVLDVTGLNRIVRSWASEAPTITDALRRKIYGADAAVAADFVNYHRTRMRVARASVFNFFLITIAGATLVVSQGAGLGSRHFWVTVVTGSILTLVSGLAFVKLTATYERCLKVVGDA
jgi:hypothetical protein